MAFYSLLSCTYLSRGVKLAMFLLALTSQGPSLSSNGRCCKLSYQALIQFQSHCLLLVSRSERPVLCHSHSRSPEPAGTSPSSSPALKMDLPRPAGSDHDDKSSNHKGKGKGKAKEFLAKQGGPSIGDTSTETPPGILNKPPSPEDKMRKVTFGSDVKGHPRAYGDPRLPPIGQRNAPGARSKAEARRADAKRFQEYNEQKQRGFGPKEGEASKLGELEEEYAEKPTEYSAVAMDEGRPDVGYSYDDEGW